MNRKSSVYSILLVILFSFCLLPFESNAALVAHWTFDEGSGTQVVDTVGGLIGTLSATGASLVSGGKAGGAISLSKAANGWVTMGDVLSLGSGPYSFVVWVKTSSTEATTVVIAKQQEGIPPGYHISINQNGAYGLPGKAWLYNLFPANSPFSITSVNDGLWHQIVGVRGNNQVKIYVDGFPVEGSQPDQGLDNPIPGTPFLVGGYPFGGNPVGTYTGLIDDIQVYNHDLSDGEVQWLFDHPGETPCTPAPSGLVSWWRAEGDAKDSWDGNHGTLQNGATFAVGKVGRAFSFAGNGDYVDAGTNSVFDFNGGTGDLTIDAWIYPAQLPPSSADGYMIVEKGTYNPFSGWGFFVWENGKLALSGIGVWSVASAAGTITANEWAHVALTKSGNTYRLYKNGVEVSSQTHDNLETSATTLKIGSDWVGTNADGNQQDSRFRGLIDEVEINDRALTAEEIATIFNAGSAGKCVTVTKSLYLPLILKTN